MSHTSQIEINQYIKAINSRNSIDDCYFQRKSRRGELVNAFRFQEVIKKPKASASQRCRIPGYLRNHAEYRLWRGILERCNNQTHRAYEYYGGRGITVCARWLDGDGEASGFEYFLIDMGERPSPEATIDRRDNNKGYSPDNCRWATHTEQMRNRRNNVWGTWRGERILLVDAYKMRIFSKRTFAETKKKLGLTSAEIFQFLLDNSTPGVI